jgi:hypothetical protein
MTVEADYTALLAGHAPLVALVGTKIALNSIPEGAVPPLVVFITTQVENRGLDNTLLDVQVSHATQCWAPDSAQALAIAAAVRGAVATNGNYTVLSQDSVFDEERGLDGIELAVERWI